MRQEPKEEEVEEMLLVVKEEEEEEEEGPLLEQGRNKKGVRGGTRDEME